MRQDESILEFHFYDCIGTSKRIKGNGSEENRVKFSLKKVFSHTNWNLITKIVSNTLNFLICILY